MDAEDAGTELEKGDDLLALGEKSLVPVLSKQGSVSIQNRDCLPRHQVWIKNKVVVEVHLGL